MYPAGVIDLPVLQRKPGGLLSKCSLPMDDPGTCWASVTECLHMCVSSLSSPTRTQIICILVDLTSPSTSEVSLCLS